MLLGETTPLRNREMHLDWKPEADFQSAKSGFQSANESVQSANTALPLPPKCKNCTLEEIAVLRVIRQNPAATQKYIATEIGKSERTVKSITVRLTEQGILVRKNGKRNGYWEIVEQIKDVLPSTKSFEQKRRLLRHILEEMKNENMIQVNGRTWFENGYKSKTYGQIIAKN